MKNVMTEEFVDLSVSDLYEIDGGRIPPFYYTPLIWVVIGSIARRMLMLKQLLACVLPTNTFRSLLCINVNVFDNV